jgi:hypothetical protein
MTVHDIVANYLREHGYAGLCNADGECGCDISDFMPCHDFCGDCEPAYLADCNHCVRGCGETYDMMLMREPCKDFEAIAEAQEKK